MGLVFCFSSVPWPGAVKVVTSPSHSFLGPVYVAPCLDGKGIEQMSRIVDVWLIMHIDFSSHNMPCFLLRTSRHFRIQQ